MSSMLGGGGTIPQSLDQLLERQWEQGSQFLMEQAQHFDSECTASKYHLHQSSSITYILNFIRKVFPLFENFFSLAVASLLSCLHQLRAENLRLEEHVASLQQRRDHLLAVNARLAIPLTGQFAAPQSHNPQPGESHILLVFAIFLLCKLNVLIKFIDFH